LVFGSFFPGGDLVLPASLLQEDVAVAQSMQSAAETGEVVCSWQVIVGNADERSTSLVHRRNDIGGILLKSPGS